jgi:Asp-tRNA(Asn)/Glu-tRNA(Gln) amidotransferase A subunit family amidase
METVPLARVSMVRPREDGTSRTFPADTARLSEDLRVRCVAAIERYRAGPGTAPNSLVIASTGEVVATYQTGEERAEVEEAGREADARTDEQRRREREKRERRRRLADRRAALSDEALAALRRRAEEALATERVERTRLGYDVLVKLKMDDLLEREGPQKEATST